MKKLKTIVMKLVSFLPALALITGIVTANSACVSLFHQPKIPQGLNKYRK